MVAQAASASPFEIDVAPALKLYMEGLTSWKENCERLLPPGALSPVANRSDPAMPAGFPAQAWPFSSAAWVQQQAELWQFYGRRMECYVELSERIARCRTPAEFGEAQLEFLRRTVADYSRQGARAMSGQKDAAGAPQPRA